MAPSIISSIEPDVNGSTPFYDVKKLAKDAAAYPEAQSNGLDSEKLHNGLAAENHSALFQNYREPLAITGLAFELPEEATSVQNFWRILLEQRCVMTEFPEDRVNIDAFYSADSTRPDTVILLSIIVMQLLTICDRFLFVEAIFSKIFRVHLMHLSLPLLLLRLKQWIHNSEHCLRLLITRSKMVRWSLSATFRVSNTTQPVSL